MSEKKVLIIMGSDSDIPVMESCFKTLRSFGVGFEARICSAHRTPLEAARLASEAESNGYDVIIGAAGMAAHLPGVLAAHTVLPVIAVPLSSGELKGFDALLAEVQMPSGVPVATVAINGASNAAILAVQILATASSALRSKLDAYKKIQADQVHEKDRLLQQKLAE